MFSWLQVPSNIFCSIMHIDFTFIRICEEALADICTLKRPQSENTILLRVSEERINREVFKEKGFEALGTYHALEADPFITLYRNAIQEYSQEHDLDPNLVTKVVLIHELAHYITHLGNAPVGGIWKNFSNASQNDKEGTAQVATWLFLRKYGHNDEMTVFNKITSTAPPEYKKWKNWSLLRSPATNSFDCDRHSFKCKLYATSNRLNEETADLFADLLYLI